MLARGLLQASAVLCKACCLLLTCEAQSCGATFHTGTEACRLPHSSVVVLWWSQSFALWCRTMLPQIL